MIKKKLSVSIVILTIVLTGIHSAYGQKRFQNYPFDSTHAYIPRADGTVSQSHKKEINGHQRHECIEDPEYPESCHMRVVILLMIIRIWKSVTWRCGDGVIG